MSSGRAAMALLAVLLVAPLAQAHLMPAQQGTLNVLENGVFVVVSLPVSALHGVDANGDGRLSDAELEQQTSAVHDQVVREFRIFDGAQPGRIDFLQLSPEPDERLDEAALARAERGAGARNFLVLMKAGFDQPPQALRVETGLLGTQANEGQLTLKATSGVRADVAVLTALHPGHQFFRGPWAVARESCLLGVEHILLGADHLIFLLTVIVAGAGWRYWASVLTAFTVAHSVTLTLALLAVARPSASVVEPLIAASIVLAAALNLRRNGPQAQGRVALVFACGLLHGLGFASALTELGLNGEHRAFTLVGFNLGLELGQAGFLLGVVAAGRALRALPLPVFTPALLRRLSLAEATSGLALIAGLTLLVDRLQPLA